MLKNILKGETCAACRICCIYDDSDVWDAPGFTETEYIKAKDKTEALFCKRDDGLYYLQMEKDSEEIYTCPCLSAKGCTLGEDKPFRCRLWPLYLIKTEHGLGIALSPVCPWVWKCKAEDIFEGIRDRIPFLLETAGEDPSLVEKMSPEYRMIALPDEAGIYHYLPDDEGTDYHLNFRELSGEEVRKLYTDVMVYDFPENELKKLDLILDLIDRGTYLTLGVFDRGVFVGYTFISTDKDKRVYILDYFAVISTLRGKGYGTRILNLLSAHFSDKKGISCEVEDPFMTEDPDAKMLRRKRMDFYLSNGWRDTGISVFMFDVDYRILSSPVGKIADPRDTLNDYRKVYIDMVGEEVLDINMKINAGQEF